MITQQLVHKLSGYITTFTFCMLGLSFLLFIFKLFHLGHMTWVDITAPLALSIAAFILMLIVIMPLALIDKKSEDRRGSK